MDDEQTVGRRAITLSEIREKTGKDKEARLAVIAELCGTDGNYKRNRKKPRAKAEQDILDMFADEGYE